MSTNTTTVSIPEKLTFGTPPPSGFTRNRWENVLPQLVKNSGDWAQVAVAHAGYNTLTNALKEFAARQGEQVEAVSRTIEVRGKQKTAIYARHIGKLPARPRYS